MRELSSLVVYTESTLATAPAWGADTTPPHVPSHCPLFMMPAFHSGVMGFGRCHPDQDICHCSHKVELAA